ncbi:MAG: PepSY domain-containing protein [Burkholderiales bacterium]|nr:PepSY domain-containing protein [Burkholderiales bacterium]MDE2564217.1 PepSY domain-containing protein [Burkholderiales bacterium]
MPRIPKRLIAFTLGAAALGGIALAARAAAEPDETPAADLARTHIGLLQAVSTAQGHAGGLATRAELGNENGRLVYDVEVVGPSQQVFDVKVDASSGAVLAAAADTADHDAKPEADEEKD